MATFWGESLCRLQGAVSFHESLSAFLTRDSLFFLLGELLPERTRPRLLQVTTVRIFLSTWKSRRQGSQKLSSDSIRCGHVSLLCL